jgi:hypothetical protein
MDGLAVDDTLPQVIPIMTPFISPSHLSNVIIRSTSRFKEAFIRLDHRPQKCPFFL